MLNSSKLFEQGWIHSYEEDTAEGAVYRPQGTKLPLSRRPRERIELAPDGTARIHAGGPDDRYIEQAARWHEEDGTIVVRAPDGGTELRIVERSPERLVVRRVKGKG
jgi:hypothetical protein